MPRRSEPESSDRARGRKFRLAAKKLSPARESTAASGNPLEERMPMNLAARRHPRKLNLVPAAAASRA